jgi:RHS repeat-associated protein
MGLLTPDPAKWDTITYKYDPYGRRIEKSGDSEAIKYSYDGGNVIAEYDGDDRLLRKYIYGARVDEPVCMIDVADSNAVYYYHFDGVGSVAALSDSDGDSVQSYEYSIYGQVAAEDPNHPNPYMFTGRRFDIETGLYHYRARCYNPHIGRFMQTDPVGYGYGYCGNNPVGYVDPMGLHETDEEITEVCIVVGDTYYDADGKEVIAVADYILESVNDWAILFVASNTEGILNAIAQCNESYGSNYTLSIQGAIPEQWNFGDDDPSSIFTQSDDNPVVQILKKSQATQIDWRNIILSEGGLGKMANVVDFSGSTAKNTFVVDTGRSKTIDGYSSVVIYDFGFPRGKEVWGQGAPGIDADYDIYGAVYEFTTSDGGTITYEKVWEWIEGNDDNNALQPY